jgi:hypothetical protein
MDRKPINKINLEELIELGKCHKNYKKLAGIIMRESIGIIKNKYREIIKGEKPIEENPIQSSKNIQTKILSQKYKTVLDQISLDYTKLEDQYFRMNIVYLRKLENLEDVLNLIPTKGKKRALDVINLFY